MDDFEKVLAAVALVATAFKAFTSGLKDIYDMTQGKRKSDAPLAKENVASDTRRRLTPPSQSNYITSTYMYEKNA